MRSTTSIAAARVGYTSTAVSSPAIVINCRTIALAGTTNRNLAALAQPPVKREEHVQGRAVEIAGLSKVDDDPRGIAADGAAQVRFYGRHVGDVDVRGQNRQRSAA